MKLNDLQHYILAAEKEGLLKIETKIEYDAETGAYYVVKTKETYAYGLEDEADEKIDNVRIDPGFVGAEKKFKAGKVSKKTGEELSPDTWFVIIKMNK